MDDVIDCCTTWETSLTQLALGWPGHLQRYHSGDTDGVGIKEHPALSRWQWHLTRRQILYTHMLARRRALVLSSVALSNRDVLVSCTTGPSHFFCKKDSGGVKYCKTSNFQYCGWLCLPLSQVLDPLLHGVLLPLSLLHVVDDR